MSGKKKILLVDDDEFVINYLLVKLGGVHDVVWTTDSRRAVAMAKEVRPDAILCDIDMPHMSGGDVVAALARDAQTAHIPVVYLTALVTPEEARDLQGQLGGRPGVSKRAQLTELLAAIDSVTGS